MRNAPSMTEADILTEVIAPDHAGWSPDVARSFLSLQFNLKATRRIRQLLRKNNQGTITAGERVTLDKYLRVGQFLDLLKAKAWLSLRQPAE